ncbi:MAG: SDR family oxidoreductase, partial [Hyphomicrobium sp.]|nr:SDR family oxidoreductase [Hyphomicrobium sp.]
MGSALLPELLARDFVVTCLVRPKLGARPEERLGPLSAHPDVRAVAGDIGLPGCGLGTGERGAFDSVIHAAADTRLELRGASDRHEINHQGTVNTIALATSLGVSEFHYVGTAYVAGTAGLLAEQDAREPVTTGLPRNPYEASKLAAEQHVRDWPGKVSIYRPSIVVGRSDDGRTHGLHGIYAVFKAAWRLHATICSGAYRDGLGRQITRQTPIPIAPGLALDQTLNLVPIDWIAKTLAALIDRPPSGRCYNLVHEADTQLASLMQAAFEALDMHNVIVSDRGGMTLSPAVAAANRAVRAELERFRPYLSGGVRFEAANAYEDLAPCWPKPAPVDA